VEQQVIADPSTAALMAAATGGDRATEELDPANAMTAQPDSSKGRVSSLSQVDVFAELPSGTGSSAGNFSVTPAGARAAGTVETSIVAGERQLDEGVGEATDRKSSSSVTSDAGQAAVAELVQGQGDGIMSLASLAEAGLKKLEMEADQAAAAGLTLVEEAGDDEEAVAAGLMNFKDNSNQAAQGGQCNEARIGQRVAANGQGAPLMFAAL
jgi:hypothetical protein